jgi:hypothetical protein
LVLAAADNENTRFLQEDASNGNRAEAPHGGNLSNSEEPFSSGGVMPRGGEDAHDCSSATLSQRGA